MKLLIGTTLASCLVASQAFADEPSQAGPEVQKLGYYVGTWEGHGQSMGGPFGPPGKLSSKFTCSWFTGGHQVVCRGEESGPTGSQEFLNIKTYNEADKAYAEYSISSVGESEDAHGGTLVGNTLSWLRDVGTPANSVKIRYAEDRVTPDLYSYRAEASVKGGPWTLIAEGKIKKVK